MAFIKTTDKWTAAHAVINTWLKDPSKYCNNCGTSIEYIYPDQPCCSDMCIGNNRQVFEAIKLQNDDRRKENINAFGATKDKSLRYALSLPPTLLTTLENYFEKTYGEKLFTDNKEMYAFMKRFPVFCIAERI